MLYKSSRQLTIFADDWNNKQGDTKKLVSLFSYAKKQEGGVKKMSKEQKNNSECKFKLEINEAIYTVDLIQSNGAKLTYEELIKKIIVEETLKIKVENVA